MSWAYSRKINVTGTGFVAGTSWGGPFVSPPQSDRFSNTTDPADFTPGVPAAVPVTLAVFYQEQAGRSTAVAHRIKDQSGTVLASLVIDQTKSPATAAAALGVGTVTGADLPPGDTDASSQDGAPQTFIRVGTVTTSDPYLTLEIEGDGAGYAIADTLLVLAAQPIPEPVYIAPAVVSAAQISPGGKMLAVRFADRHGNPVTLQSFDVAKPPQVSINGAAPITLPLGTPNVVWEPGYQTDPQSYAAFPLPVALAHGDTLTLTVQDAWATTAQGACGAATDLAADNLVGTSFLPIYVAGNQTMGIGTNITQPLSYLPVMIFRNLKRQLGDWVDNSGAYDFAQDSDGQITTMGSFGAIQATVVQPLPNPGDPSKTYLSAPPGLYTFVYQGGTAQLYAANDNTTDTVVSTSTDGQGVTTVVYSFTAADPDQGVAVGLQLGGAPGAPGARIIGIHPPDPASPLTRSLDDSAIFHPSFLRMLAGYKSLRFMDALGTNNSNVSDFADFNLTTCLSYSRQNNAQTLAALASVGPYDNADGFFQANTIHVLITTSAPHGFREGQTITFGGIAGPGETTNPQGTFPVANPADTITMNGRAALVHVRTATTFAVAIGADTAAAVAGQGLAQSYTSIGTAPVAQRLTRIGWAPLDCVNLCNALGADLRLNVPHAASDACATALAALVAANLAPGLKCRIEYSNETWNFQFQQFGYCLEQGGQLGLDPNQFYAQRAGAVFALAQAAFDAAGRGADLIKTLGTCLGDTGTGAARVDYAVANNIPFHRLAPAPYFWSGPANDALGDVYTPLDQSQRMDVAELIAGGPQIAGLMAANYALVKDLPGNITLDCYEGGCEFGGLVGTGDRGAWSRAWARDPRMRGIYLHFLTTLQANGCTTYHDYQACGPVASVNFVANSAVYPTYTAWNQPDGTGDGSDGLFDNRTNFEDLGQIVSVKGGALRKWIADSNATPPAGGEDTHRRRRGIASRSCDALPRRRQLDPRRAA